MPILNCKSTSTFGTISVRCHKPLDHAGPHGYVAFDQTKYEWKKGIGQVLKPLSNRSVNKHVNELDKIDRMLNGC